MKEKLIYFIKSYYKYFILVFLVIFINTFTFDYEIYSPGGLEDLKDRIIVDDAYNAKGSINLTYVTSRRANITNLIIAAFNPSWDVISINESRIENERVEDIFLRGQIYLKQTSYDAIIAAFNEANIEYIVNSSDIVISYIFESADTNLKIGDIIKSIEGQKVNSLNDIRIIIKDYKENDKVKINVLRDDKVIECTASIKVQEDEKIIGISVAELHNITTNPKVKYVFKDNESGASRGLLCALDIYNKITSEDITKGFRISGTGSIDASGNVGAIDGVKYKLQGAVKNKADIFIVPSENYDEALKIKNDNNYDIKLIKASTLSDVIKELKK